MAAKEVTRAPILRAADHRCCRVTVRGRKPGEWTSWANALKEAERWIAAGFDADVVDMVRPGLCLACISERQAYEAERARARKLSGTRERDLIALVRDAFQRADHAKRQVGEAIEQLEKSLKQRAGSQLTAATLVALEQLGKAQLALAAARVQPERYGLVSGAAPRERAKMTYGSLRRDALYRCIHCSRRQDGSPWIWHQDRWSHLRDEHMLMLEREDEAAIAAHFGPPTDPDAARGTDEEDE